MIARCKNDSICLVCFVVVVGFRVVMSHMGE